ncbi:MAG: glutathione S-transferase family protein, partial [Myxococcota bacterium]
MKRPDHYVLYGWQRSYFTHKLMAALDYYRAQWSYADKTTDNAEELRLRSGTHQVPVLHTPEGWMLADTTPIMRLLDDRHPTRRLFGTGATGVFVQLLEEYFDEWIARTTVHWRWNYEENHELLAMDAAHGNPELAQSLIVWGGKVCRATGVDSERQQRSAEEEYHRIMASAEEQLQRTPFLLGDRPTAVDCIVLAGLRAHFLFDPAPKRVLYTRYPNVVRWTETDSKAWDGKGELAEYKSCTPFAEFILSEMKTTYAPFVRANRDAIAGSKKAFVI